MNEHLINASQRAREEQLRRALINVELAISQTTIAIYQRDQRLKNYDHINLKTDLLIPSQQLSFDWLINH